MQEFKINDTLSLKLEGKHTYIYIKDVRLFQCIRLTLNLDKNEIGVYDEIDSIDEAADIYKQTLWINKIVEGPMALNSRFQNQTITPEEEFWGHCSNLQVWAEHNYDTRLLHSNLSFPLLKKLTDAGDPIAKKYFKEEIAKRYLSNYVPVKEYIQRCGYLRYLNKEELASIGASETLVENFTQNELTHLTPVQLSDLDNEYNEIIEKILDNRNYHTKEFFRIARITKFPSILVTDFSTIPEKYPSILSSVYLRFIIAPRESFGKLSTAHINSIRFEPSLRYNLEVNVIDSTDFFVTLLDLVYFHLTDLWA